MWFGALRVAAARAAGERAEEMCAAIGAMAASQGGPVDLEADYRLIHAEVVQRVA